MAADRAIQIARRHGLPYPRRRWELAAREIRAAALTQSWNAERQTFTEQPGAPEDWMRRCLRCRPVTSSPSTIRGWCRPRRPLPKALTQAMDCCSATCRKFPGELPAGLQPCRGPGQRAAPVEGGAPGGVASLTGNCQIRTRTATGYPGPGELRPPGQAPARLALACGAAFRQTLSTSPAGSATPAAHLRCPAYPGSFVVGHRDVIPR